MQDRIAGFTLIELLIVLTIGAVILGVGTTSYREFTEATTASKAARLVAGDATLTRSYAIRRRANVSLVADEATRSYVIREAGGAVLSSRSFDASSELPLTALDVDTAGDSLTFNSRGLLVGAAQVEIDVTRYDRAFRVQLNALGRHQILKL
ncbi:MAG: GspH/FimT family pseudopilin [Gemmatimonadota bacterium]